MGNKLYKVTLMRTAEVFVEADSIDDAKKQAVAALSVADYDACPNKTIGNAIVITKHNAGKILAESVISRFRDYDAVVGDVVGR